MATATEPRRVAWKDMVGISLLSEITQCKTCKCNLIITVSGYMSCPGPEIHGKLIPQSLIARRIEDRKYELERIGVDLDIPDLRQGDKVFR